MPVSWDEPETVPLSRIIAALESGISVNGEDRTAQDGEPGVLKVSAVGGGHFFPEGPVSIRISSTIFVAPGSGRGTSPPLATAAFACASTTTI